MARLDEYQSHDVPFILTKLNPCSYAERQGFGLAPAFILTKLSPKRAIRNSTARSGKNRSWF